MKKFLFGIFLGLIFILSVKLDSFASGGNTFYFGGKIAHELGVSTYPIRYNCNISSPYTTSNLCIYVSGYTNEPNYNLPQAGYNFYSNANISFDWIRINLETNEQATGSKSFSKADKVDGIQYYYSSKANLYNLMDFYSSIPIFENLSDVYYYLGSGDVSNAVNKDSLPFDSVVGSSSIPTPVVNWALNSDGSLSRTLQFTNAQLPQNPNIRMGLQLIVHWASVDNISMSYANQSANFLGTGYAVYYDNALSQDGQSMGYPLPESVSDMKPCPAQIDFLTDSHSIELFNNFLVAHPVSERTITYSPSGISSFADSFRSHLGNIDFAYNVPFVSCRFYYKSVDGSDLNYGGWTTTYPKLPSQGAVLSINKQNGQITVPINDGTFNQGTDINGNPIFDNGTTIQSPDLVNFDDLNNSVHNLFSYLGQFPSFLAYLFPFLPSWIPILLASIIGTLLVIGLVRIILK